VVVAGRSSRQAAAQACDGRAGASEDAEDHIMVCDGHGGGIEKRYATATNHRGGRSIVSSPPIEMKEPDLERLLATVLALMRICNTRQTLLLSARTNNYTISQIDPPLSSKGISAERIAASDTMNSFLSHRLK
jgi:hypothetical protein